MGALHPPTFHTVQLHPNSSITLFLSKFDIEKFHSVTLLRVRELKLSLFGDEGGPAFPLTLIEVLLARTGGSPFTSMFEVVAVIGAMALSTRNYIVLIILFFVSSLLDHFDLLNRYPLSNGCVLAKLHD